MASLGQVQRLLMVNIQKNQQTSTVSAMSEASNRFQINQSKRCKVFDKHYGNRQKLDGFQSHLACTKNEYNNCQNLDGFVNFGTSINQVIAKTTLKYLPSFMQLEDCSYPDPRGYDQFNKKVCEGTKFWWDETFTFNSIYSILSLFCYKYKNVFVVGKSDKTNLEVIFDHSQSKIAASEQSADLVILFHHSKELIRKIEQKSPNSVKLFILSSKENVNQFDANKNNHAFAYQFALKEGLILALLHTKETKIKKNICNQWNFFTTSTITRRASQVPDLNINIDETGTEALRKMIQMDSKVIVPKQNTWFTLGATSGMDTISRALFKNVTIGVDATYYGAFNNFFTHTNVKIVSKPILPGLSQLKGLRFAGYIICIPKNLDGTVLEPQEVDQICQFVRNKQYFHLVFDEIFLNTCFGKETKSAASYAVQLPNIHIVRGMAKDFGLCGFKVGFAISSNPIVMKKFQQWKPIISHHPYTISVVNSMLRKSNYGTEIFEVGKQILRDYFEIVYSELDKQKISYKKPEAGCFVFVDLKQFMREQTLDEQNILWKKLFYKYRVNLSNGVSFNAPQFGYFRISPIMDEQIMREGLKRMIVALKDKQEQ